MKKLLSLLCAAVLVLTSAACASDAAASPLAGRRVAYVMQMASSEIFQLWSDAAQQTAQSLGMEYQAFFCDGSHQAWQDTIVQCAQQGYDGLLLSHGGQDYAYSFLQGLLEDYPQLKIVTFDTLFLDPQGQEQKLPGVTQFFQQDGQIAELLLSYICQELYPDKTASGQPVNILKVWAGPGTLAAFDRRQEGYARYEEQGLIATVETIAPQSAAGADAQASMAQVAAQALARYEAGQIDAIWCCYDLYARGVYEALVQSGCQIPLVSADICDADLAMMAQQDSPWMACATTNWSLNGEFGMRVLALELAGEYDRIVDPASGEVSDWLEIPPFLVTQQDLSGADPTVADLTALSGDSAGWMPTASWMP